MEPRPKTHLHAFGQRYPGAWKLAEQMFADRGKALPEWPAWCFLPIGHASAILQHLGNEPEGGRPTSQAAVVNALATWRFTQGIYRFDPTVLDALWDTPIEGKLPVELLFRLPEWCVYVETPNRPLFEHTLQGFFAYLAPAHDDRRPLLQFVLDTDEQGLHPFPLPLVAKGLTESFAEVCAASQRAAASDGKELPISEGFVQRTAAGIAPLVSVLLYLCSGSSELRDASGTLKQPQQPQFKRTRKGTRLFAPDKPTTWEAGYRLGAALRNAYAQERAEPTDTHASPRPHIRRAHWHAFWTGPKSEPAQRKLDVRWLPPIPVAVQDLDELVPVVRPVKLEG